MQLSTNAVMDRREALKRVTLLLGGAVSAPTLAGVLAGCGRRAAEGGALTPQALSAEQAELVAAIAEQIIPETDTPGARAARVQEFIDEMLASYYPAHERDLFLTGLSDVDERAQQAHGNRFLACTPTQQFELVAELDREAFGPGATEEPDEEADETGVREQTESGAIALSPNLELDSIPDPDSIRWVTGEERESASEITFFRTMKELALVGYYTSEIGATNELRHEPVPGRYEGCVPFAQIGRTWAV